jgi:hypothetical protein
MSVAAGILLLMLLFVLFGLAGVRVACGTCPDRQGVGKCGACPFGPGLSPQGRVRAIAHRGRRKRR